MQLVDEELYNYIYKIQPIEFFSSKKKRIKLQFNIFLK